MSQFVYRVVRWTSIDEGCYISEKTLKIYKNEIDAQRAVIRWTRVNTDEEESYHYFKDMIVEQCNPLEDENEAEVIKNWNW